MNVLPDFRTLRPASIADAVVSLSAEGAVALGGGTDLLPNLRRGLGEPKVLVDLTAVKDLSTLTQDADGGLRIGAGVTVEAIAENELVRTHWPALAQAAQSVAGPTHRAGATLGGNLCQDTRCIYYNESEWWRSSNGFCLKYKGSKCHVVVKSDRCYATYHGDIAPALIALDARAEVVGPSGKRTLPVAALFQEDGAERLTLTQGEILVAIEVPSAHGWKSAYNKVRIRDEIDFPLAGVAMALRREGDKITGLRVAVTGTNSAPLSIPTDAFVGTCWNDATAESLTESVHKLSKVLKTTMIGAKYRRRVLLAVARQTAQSLWQQD